jgi:hypothetical protein
MARDTAGSSSPTAARRARSRQYLLSALLPDASAFQSLARASGGELDWEWILERSIMHKVQALVASRSIACDVPGLPAPVRGAMEHIQRQSVLRACRQQRTLHEVAAALDSCGIPFILLKGPFLAEHVYRNPLVRTSCDLDVLVHPDDIPAACGALQSMGYRLAHGTAGRASPHSSADGEPSGHELSCTHPDGLHFPIDLHWRLSDPGVYRAATSDVWAHTSMVQVAGTMVRVLELEATLVHLAAHAVVERPAHLWFSHFTDIAWFLARFGADCSGERVRQVAREWKAEVYLDRALQVVGEVFGAAVPDHLAALPEESRLRRSCFRRVSSGLLEGASWRAAGNEGGLRDGIQALLWCAALRMPAGFAARQLVWRPLWPLLPPWVLAGVRGSTILRRMMGT